MNLKTKIKRILGRLGFEYCPQCGSHLILRYYGYNTDMYYEHPKADCPKFNLERFDI